MNARRGPILEHRPGRVTLKDDSEGPSGTAWTLLTFVSSIAVRFTPDPACAAWMVEAYSRVAVVEDSEWLEDLRAASRGEGMIPATARHFVVYFDHVGCWEILADDVILAEDDT